jgi:hypothetical protein
VIKYITRQHPPINEFLAFNCLEALPDDTSFIPFNDRSDSYRAVVDNTLHSTIVNLRSFLVGIGAISCEELNITELVNAEYNDRSRYFLFRESDIWTNKVVFAVNAMLEMNSALHIKPHMNCINESTLSISDAAFCESLSGVCHGLGNVVA